MPSTTRTGSQELVSLLERCTDDLFQRGKHFKDIRFLRVWIQRADSCRDPEDVFRFLEVHQIGQDFALFYEARALCLEKRGSHRDAMAAYELGIANMAMPVDRLRRKLQAFHGRMARRAERDARRSHQATPAQRQALSSIQRPGPEDYRTPVQGGGRAARGPEGNARELSVYTDTPGGAVGGGGARTALSSLGAGPLDGEASRRDWTRLQTEQERSKENEQAASRWNTYSVAQGTVPADPAANAGADAAGGPSLEILVDDEFVEPQPFSLPRQEVGVRTLAEGQAPPSGRKASARKPKAKPSESVLVFPERESRDAVTGEDVSVEERRAEWILARMAAAGTAGPAEREAEAEAEAAQGEDVTLFTREAFECIDAMFTSQKAGRADRADVPSEAPFSHQKKLDFGCSAAEEAAVEIYEDTAILPSGAGGPGLGLGNVEEEGKENGPLAAPPSIGRAPHRELGGALPLDEVSDEDLLSRGIEVGTGLALDDDADDDDIFARDESLLELPADRLRSFRPSEDTDDFSVFEDE